MPGMPLPLQILIVIAVFGGITAVLVVFASKGGESTRRHRGHHRAREQSGRPRWH
ncbi:hypothetical protein [Actinoallomurus sp. NPDC050550]|uniref:hypothetical protein n=1 Tax=Actinoallomurus sp. NPDC050550 TaxID=3154937 RepID=UPI0033CE724A